MHPRLLDFDRPHTPENRPARQMAVADNLPMTGLVANLDMGIDPTSDLGFYGLDQKSLGTFPEDPTQHIFALGQWKDGCVNARIDHGGVLLCLVGNWVKQIIYTQSTPPFFIRPSTTFGYIANQAHRNPYLRSQ